MNDEIVTLEEFKEKTNNQTNSTGWICYDDGTLRVPKEMVN